MSGVMASPAALAAEQTASIGYAHAQLQDVGNLNGFTLQYRYEWDTLWSVIGGLSYMQGSNNNAYQDAWGDTYKTDINAKYTSLLLGPAYRINDYVSVYGLLGAAYTKMDGSYEWRNSVGADTPNGHLSITSSSQAVKLAYAAGVVINPINTLSINIGYEGSQADLYGGNKTINGFTVGIGWRF
ncbi:enterobacterial Ail/Lom family protein [Edwardsiella ictaluri 93-146]|uniref:Enterobacterial Ail/Lom family protein n=1 Tax=Edwardsiella ictaluri (strain 93-146) TaxID=634503 RepID=C5B939_EDWI9|nr:enterobacterial Ail/Lom family protein [Edwardsiella ictaluri 93-146]